MKEVDKHAHMAKKWARQAEEQNASLNKLVANFKTQVVKFRKVPVFMSYV